MYAGLGYTYMEKNQRWNRVSGNFPETAWRVASDCQATQGADPVSGFFFMNRRATEYESPGDASMISGFFAVLSIL